MPRPPVIATRVALSVRTGSTGRRHWRARWTDPISGRRRTASLGPCEEVTKRQAAQLAGELERKINAGKVADRLGQLGEHLTPSFGSAIDRYLADRPKLAEPTRRKLEQLRGHAAISLGDRPVAELGAADLLRFRADLETRPAARGVPLGARRAAIDEHRVAEVPNDAAAATLSPASVAGILATARAVWRHAARLGWCDGSAFAGVVPTVVTDAPAHGVPAGCLPRLLAACPDEPWRRMLWLCRGLGLRFGEARRLDRRAVRIDGRGRVWVDLHAGVTTRTTKRRRRSVPADPDKSPIGVADELRRWAFEADRAGLDPATPLVFPRTFDNNAGRDLRAIIRRAGLAPWPKVFHALRAARQSELAAVYPEWAVCRWLGNSVAVARDHYLSDAAVLGDHGGGDDVVEHDAVAAAGLLDEQAAAAGADGDIGDQQIARHVHVAAGRHAEGAARGQRHAEDRVADVPVVVSDVDTEDANGAILRRLVAEGLRSLSAADRAELLGQL